MLASHAIPLPCFCSHLHTKISSRVTTAPMMIVVFLLAGIAKKVLGKFFLTSSMWSLRVVCCNLLKYACMNESYIMLLFPTNYARMLLHASWDKILVSIKIRYVQTCSWMMTRDACCLASSGSSFTCFLLSSIVKCKTVLKGQINRNELGN